ncbi:uncharacterized protein [Palaemon carinicauda]|uniref:uncharacterized protein n=1 Tax=Palaemon carinicauda TaxID=392227 RepID=UPI0035B5A12F
MLLLPVTIPTKNMPSAFSEEDFLYSKYLKCVLVHGCQAVQDIVRAIYRRKCMRTRNGTMSIRDFNIRANVDPYYGGMSCFLDCNIMEENFDISFGYRLLKEEHICGEAFNGFSEVSKDQMYYIINQRNKVCHNFGRNTDISVQVDILKTCIIGIYQEASKKLNIDFNSNDKCIVEKIDGTMNAKVTEAIGKNCLEGLHEFKESLRFKMLSSGRDELFDYYRTLKTLSPCSWINDENHAEIFDIEKIFTAPKIWAKNTKTKVDICMKNLLKFKLKTKTVPNILFIKGLAGSGKTSLCRYLAHSWYKETGTIDTLDCFELVILIEIRRSSSVTLIEYLREELLSDTCYEFKPDHIICLMEEMNLLFIIDGFDENPTKAGALMQDIFNNFQNKRMIVTSRLNYEKEIGSIAEEFQLQPLTVTLEGFEESEQKVFTEKVFSIVDRSCEGFLKYLNGRGRVLNKHLKLPLTTSLLIVLWMEKPKVVNKITTATSLYYEIFSLYQEKLAERLIVNLRARQLEALKKKIPSLLLLLGGRAWFLLTLENGCCELSDSLRKTLEEKCEERGIDASEFFSAFLMCEVHHSKLKNSNSILNHKYQYSFIHRTQMEYLAADFLAQEIKNGSLTLCEIDKKVSDWRNHSEVLVYLSGNMAKKNILKGNEKAFLKLAEKTGAGSTDFLYWWKIISESHIIADIPESPDKPIYYKKIQHPELATAIYDKHLSENTDWDLDDKEVAAGLRLMSLLNPVCLSATTLSINIPHGVDPLNVPDFYDALSAVEDHWNKKIKKKKIKISLHLYHHNSTRSNGSTSEHFLLALKNWAELQNFTGSLKNVTYSLAEGYPKNIRCLITEPCALRSFENLPDSVRCLRLTLGFSLNTCTLDDLTRINFTGKLELFIPDMCDEQLNTLIKVIKKLSGNDLKNLHLTHSKLTYNSVMDLVKSMNGILKSTLYITRLNFRNASEEKKLLGKAEFRVEWMD